MQGAFGFNIEITMMLKEVKITITVSSEFAEYIKQLVAPHVRPKTAIPLPKPPISQAEWLLKTPEGKQFAQDCMKFKYSRLSHKQLIQLATKLYYKTYGIDPTNKARQYIPCRGFRDFVFGCFYLPVAGRICIELGWRQIFPGLSIN